MGENANVMNHVTDLPCPAAEKSGPLYREEGQAVKTSGVQFDVA